MKFANAVQERALTSGTLAFQFAGSAEPLHAAFGNSFGDGDDLYYEANDGANREIGMGQWVAAGNFLNRITTLWSTTGSKINFPAPPLVTATVASVWFESVEGETTYFKSLRVAMPSTVRVLTGNITLDQTESANAWLDPGGADRNVTLTTTNRHEYYVRHGGTANELKISDPNGEVATLLAYEPTARFVLNSAGGFTRLA